jgi:hypothetical protein
MLRIATVPVLALVLAVVPAEAQVVSSKLCASQDYDEAKKDCAAGKALEGSNISVTENTSVMLLSTIKSDTSKDIYHVWIAEGAESKPGGKVSVYDAATNTLRDAEQADLDWLKERKIEGAKAIVKLPVVASGAFRTRSVKTVGPKSAGNWRVQIYDSGTTPLGEVSFTVK